MRVLVTGGAGYIGSHTCLELLRSGCEVQVVDSLCNGHVEALQRIKKLSNRELNFSHCDVRDSKQLDAIFATFQPDAVIHLAGLKAVAESIIQPERYYDVNVGGTAVLLNAMKRVGCRSIVFSSSATVYGRPTYLPCDENHPLCPINPYGRTKLIGEQLLMDWVGAESGRRAIALRYFNPVGADYSGLIGEHPHGTPNNLMPFVAQVASGYRECLDVFGDDYETKDGTGVRDYIHVTDLATAHVTALMRLEKLDPFEAINIGTGNGNSVLELVREFEKVSGRSISFRIAPRRPGDAPQVWADASLALAKIGFKAKLGMLDMCRDTWRWQTSNPKGFSDR